MNAVVLMVMVMMGLSLVRVHVVLSLIVAAVIGGVMGGLGLTATMEAFEMGIQKGASIALSYAMLGAFAMAIAHSGLPRFLAQKAISGAKSGTGLKWYLIGTLILLSCASQNLIPIHIAFIPLVVPPLLGIFNDLKLDRRLVACVLTFGLVNTYMFIPYGFGDIFLNQIILKNIQEAGVDPTGVSLYRAMFLPMLGMVSGLVVAAFISYRAPRIYVNAPIQQKDRGLVNKTHIYLALLSVALAFAVQLFTNSMLLGSMAGFALFMATGVVRLQDSQEVFGQGIRLMAMIGFVMIAAQGFAEVMKATGDIDTLVASLASAFEGQKGIAIFLMLILGLLVTMGIGSSFSTVPVIAAVYVPLCVAFGMSPAAIVSLIATAGVLGDAGSPASDSTLGPTSGLDADGQHDHIRDSVLPTFIHYNLPLIAFGWVAAMVL